MRLDDTRFMRDFVRASALVAMLGGCAPKPAIVIPDSDTYPIIAVAGQYAAMSKASPEAPEPRYKCENCRDTGFVGDGTVKSPCPVCNGGK